MPFRSLMLVEELLDGGLLVSARANQILLSVLQFVLIERQLRLLEAPSRS